MKINIEKIQLFLLKLFIIMLPYHYMIVCIIGKNIPILKMWKEAFIIAIFIIDLILLKKNKQQYKFKKLDAVFGLFLIVLIVYTLISDNMYAAIYIGRIYFLPILLVPIVSHMKLDTKQIKNILYIITINTIIISIWGIIQSVFLGDSFLINIGYDHYFNEYLDCERLNPSFYISGITNFQRLTSTFVAPNTCAMYLAIVFTLILYLHKKIKMNKKLFYLSLSVISISILLTFSRSTWIAWGISILIYVIKYIKINKNNLKYIGLAIIIIIASILIIDTLILHNTIIKIGFHLIENTFNFNDTSTVGHIDSLKNSFEIFIDNMLGLGLGNNGPRAINLIGENNTNLTESSYFLILYDVGIIGFIIYYWIYIKVIQDNMKITKENNMKDIMFVAVVTIMFLISYIFLPYVQEFELMAMLYMIIGIQYNDKILSKEQ